MIWHNHHIFITGVTGLPGSWLVEQLLIEGTNVTCLIRHRVPCSRLVNEGLLDHANVVRGELED